ncbi:DUF262 domain-containing protein [Mycoplasma sp. NEAQ87857]|uniref:DUF262 domain-containing protein n=1 Tax=Mycoplasma sp. NEAQ87857 TaxID=2683967 RepID=UPI00131B10A2|nr:DUF262 domain-containing protein [Mycoplasma sp. NEAQ87857]
MNKLDFSEVDYWNIATNTFIFIKEGLYNWIDPNGTVTNIDSIIKNKNTEIKVIDIENIYANGQKLFNNNRRKSNWKTQVYRVYEYLGVFKTDYLTQKHYFTNEFRELWNQISLKTYDESMRYINDFLFKNVISGANDTFIKFMVHKTIQNSKFYASVFISMIMELSEQDNNPYIQDFVKTIQQDNKFKNIKDFKDIIKANKEGWKEMCVHLLKDNKVQKTNKITELLKYMYKENYIEIEIDSKDEKPQVKESFNDFILITKSDISTYSLKNYQSNIESESGIKTIKNYLMELNNNGYVNIPIFQRNYVWDEEIVEILLSDIDDKVSKNDVEEHFLGNVVISNSNKKMKNCQNIIDGQQRTTTIIIILYVVYKFFIKYNFDVPQDLYNWFKVEETYNGIKTPNILSKYNNLDDSMSYKHFREMLMDNWSDELKKDVKKIKYKSISPQFIIYRNMKSIFNFLNDKLSSLDDEQKLNYLNNFTFKFLNWFIINVSILVTKNDYEYYQKMNLLSKPLNDVELIKSLVYGKASSLTGKDKDKLIKELDQYLLSQFLKTNNDTVEDIFNVVIKSVALYELGEKEFLKIDNSGSKNRISSTYKYFEKLLDFKINEFQDIKKAIKWIIIEVNRCCFVSGCKNTIWQQQDTRINEANFTFLERIKVHLDLITNYGEIKVFSPLIFSLCKRFDLFSDERCPNQNLTQFWNMLFEIERFGFFWKHYWFKGQSLTKVMNGFAQDIKDKEINDDMTLRDKLIGSITGSNILFNKSKDEQINTLKETLLESDVKGWSNKIRLNFLLRIEWFLMNQGKSLKWNNEVPNENLGIYQDYFKKQISYEHMFAKKSNKNNVSSQYIESIGNGIPAIFETNVKMGKDPFTKKKEKYYTPNNFSRYFTYKGLDEYKDQKDEYQDTSTNINQWQDIDDKKIKCRRDALINILIKMYLD